MSEFDPAFSGVASPSMQVNQVVEDQRRRAEELARQQAAVESAARSRRLVLAQMNEKAEARLGDLQEARLKEMAGWGIGGAVLGGLAAWLYWRGGSNA